MEIRAIDRTSKKDIRMLSELFREYAIEIKRNLSANVAIELSELPYFKGFMAFNGEQPLAFCVCFESYSSYRSRFVWNIHDVMVAKSARGAGVGKKLLEFVLSQAKEANVVKLTLEVEDGNSVAKKLYKDLDFQDFRVTAPNELHWQVYLSE